MPGASMPTPSWTMALSLSRRGNAAFVSASPDKKHVRLLARGASYWISAQPPIACSSFQSPVPADARSIFVKEFRQRNASSSGSLFDLKAVSSSRPAICSRRRAQEPSRSAVAPTFPAFSALARSHLDGSEHDGTLGAIGTTIRGKLAIGRADHRATTLYSVGP